jgi:hypothetical protein
MFTFNPFWRDTSHNLYAYVFNALMNYNDLHVGAVEEEKVKATETTTDP